MTVRWCGIGHHSFTHVEEEGRVAMAILLPYLAPSGKEKRGGGKEKRMTMAIILP